MRAAAEEATRLLRALADADRLLVLCELAQGERCIRDLEKTLVSEPDTLPQHLNVLANLGLVSTRMHDQRRYYAIRDPRVLGVLLSLYRLYCAPRPESRS